MFSISAQNSKHNLRLEDWLLWPTPENGCESGINSLPEWIHTYQIGQCFCNAHAPHRPRIDQTFDGLLANADRCAGHSKQTL